MWWQNKKKKYKNKNQLLRQAWKLQLLLTFKIVGIPSKILKMLSLHPELMMLWIHLRQLPNMSLKDQDLHCLEVLLLNQSQYYLKKIETNLRLNSKTLKSIIQVILTVAILIRYSTVIVIWHLVQKTQTKKFANFLLSKLKAPSKSCLGNGK